MRIKPKNAQQSVLGKRQDNAMDGGNCRFTACGTGAGRQSPRRARGRQRKVLGGA